MIGTGRRHKDCGKRPQKQTKKTDRGEEEQDGWQQKGDWHSRSEDWQRRLTEFCPLFISFQRFRGVFSCLVLLLEIIIIALQTSHFIHIRSDQSTFTSNDHFLFCSVNKQDGKWCWELISWSSPRERNDKSCLLPDFLSHIHCIV